MSRTLTTLTPPPFTSLNSTGGSTTVAACSGAITVGSGNVLDHLVQVTVSTGAYTPGNLTAVVLSVFGTLDGVNWSGTSASVELVDGTDKPITISPTGSQGFYLGSVNLNASSATLRSGVFSVAAAFNGTLPLKYVVVASSSLVLSATGNSIAVAEVTY